MNPIDWQAAAMVMSLLAALCGRKKFRPFNVPRHQRDKVKHAGRSVMSIRTRVLRECAEHRFTRALTIAVPTLYLPTRGTLAPETPTNPLRAAAPSPLNSLQFQQPDIELMQRVLDGLRELPAQQPST